MCTMKPQIHWSHLSMMFRCGEQYRRRYVENEICPPGVALLVGSATHKGVEVNMRCKLESGEAADAAAVADAARDHVVGRWETEGVDLDEEERSRGEGVVRGEAVQTAVDLSLLHYREIAPKIGPTHVERPWVVELKNFHRDLAGRIDLQERGRIRDTKTFKRTPPAGAADDSDQLTMYALAGSVLDGAIPELRLDALVKLKVSKAITFSTQRSAQDLAVLLRRIERFSEALDRGVFLPADQSNWCCDPRYCGYARTCPYHRGRVQA